MNTPPDSPDTIPDYAPSGFVQRAYEAKRIGGQQITLYQIDSMTARDQVQEVIWGNGYKTIRNYDAARGLPTSVLTTDLIGLINVQNLTVDFDDFGNLISRYNQGLGIAANDPGGSQVAKDLYETYFYDQLNRLRETRSQGLVVNDQTYDGFGNIMTKSDVGTYIYGANAGPHAVTSLSSGVNYFYDDAGNLTSDTSLNGNRIFNYTAFDKPSSVVKDVSRVEFSYGADRSRVKRVDKLSGVVSKTTLYMGNVEKITQSDGAQIFKRYIDGQVLVSQEQNGVSSTQYLIADHLGSVELVLNHDVGPLGSDLVAADMSYNAWGQRREAIDGAPMTIANLLNFDSSTTHGFTGHEMLDTVGIVHMNGRIYDPLLARFVQADPFVENSSDLQVYNRYSYVRNNPLNATDPSGFVSVGLSGGDCNVCFSATGGYGDNGWSFSGSVSGFANLTPDFQFSLPDLPSLGSTNIDMQAFARSFDTSAKLGDVGSGDYDFEALYNNFALTYGLAGTYSETSGGKFINAARSFSYSEGLSAEDFRYEELSRFGLADNSGQFDEVGARLTAKKESFASFFGERVMSGQVRDDMFAALDMTLAAGEGAAQFWADIAVNSDHPLASLANVPGVFASAWTRDTAGTTFLTLSTAGTIGVGYAKGLEFTFRGSKNFRIAFFGNRTGHPTGKFPHYHRHVPGRKPGTTKPGGSVDRHRPWDSKGTDKSFWDRF